MNANLLIGGIQNVANQEIGVPSPARVWHREYWDRFMRDEDHFQQTMNEAETRADHIDPALTAAGWGVFDGSRIRREYQIAPGRIEGHGRHGNPLIADYVLEYRNTKLPLLSPSE